MNFFQENETCIVVDGKKSFVVARIWGWCVMMVISQTQGERERTRARHYYKDASIHSTTEKNIIICFFRFTFSLFGIYFGHCNIVLCFMV